VCDISDVYESFIMKIVSELLVEGPNAPFYRTLIEAGLGTGFSPSTGKALQIFKIQYTIYYSKGNSSSFIVSLSATTVTYSLSFFKDNFALERVKIFHRLETL
jgi:Zn-dependent M16 (insulinase) family peptidase